MGEKFADVWVLLSDTDRFVSRARLMKRYEGQLRRWRSELSESRGDTERIREIREEIIAFRRARRAEGWELRLDPPVNRVLPIADSHLEEFWLVFGGE